MQVNLFDRFRMFQDFLVVLRFTLNDVIKIKIELYLITCFSS